MDFQPNVTIDGETVPLESAVLLTPAEQAALMAHFRYQYLPYTDRGQTLSKLIDRIERAQKGAA